MGSDIVEQVNQDVMSWAESQIDEITHLRETDTFRKEFIGNLAHELKTPIFNIQGFILTLLEGGIEDPEINRKFLLKAAKNVERMSGLLEDLDVITKMEAGNLDIDLVPFDLLDIVQGDHREFGTQSQTQQHRLEHQKRDGRLHRRGDGRRRQTRSSFDQPGGQQHQLRLGRGQHRNPVLRC